MNSCAPQRPRSPPSGFCVCVSMWALRTQHHIQFQPHLCSRSLQPSIHTWSWDLIADQLSPACWNNMEMNTERKGSAQPGKQPGNLHRLRGGPCLIRGSARLAVGVPADPRPATAEAKGQPLSSGCSWGCLQDKCWLSCLPSLHACRHAVRFAFSLQSSSAQCNGRHPPSCSSQPQPL